MTLEYPADANARRERAFERIRDNGSARLVALTTSRPPNGNRSINPKTAKQRADFGSMLMLMPILEALRMAIDNQSISALRRG